MTEKTIKVLTSGSDAALDVQCKDIIGQIENPLTTLSIVFFHDARTLDDYLACDRILQEVCKEYLGEDKPLVSFVAQAPVSGRLTAEVLSINGAGEIECNGDYLLVNTPEGKELISQGIHFPGCGDIGEQSAKVFSRIREILDTEGFSPSDIVRQWNYIDHITQMNDGLQNYQMFNDARSAFYKEADWSGGYPAATGIGCSAGGVMVSIYAVKDSSVESKPIDNPVQVPAHKYSGKVLEAGRQEVRTTPKFERARLLGDTVYVSGTAAIKGEDSEFSKDAKVQSESLIDVVEHLVAPENIAPGCKGFKFDMLRVYVKYPEDTQAIMECLGNHWKGVPMHFLIADICRPEPLLELEGTGKAI